MSDYTVSNSGQVTSKKSSLGKVFIFSFCLILLGLLILFHSVALLYNQENFLHLQVFKAYFALPASVILVCSGLFVIVAELRYPTVVLISRNGVKVMKGQDVREIEWCNVGYFERDRFGITISAAVLNSKPNDKSDASFRVPLVGSDALNFANFLNEIRISKHGLST